MEIPFLTYLKTTIKISEFDGLLLAVSGGVDSMCMLRLFEGTKYKVVVAHCNFSLRGEHSDGDEELIKAYCSQRGIKFETIKFDTLGYAAEQKISMEMAARDLRYTWFEGLLKKHKLQWIATAHHAQDSLETALLNLTRGTGLSGLKGILPKTDRVIRPLLFAKKDDIKAFAEQEGIPWREDSSNASDKYNRNHVRHHVIPLLEKLNPKVVENFHHTSSRVTNALDYIKNELLVFKRDYLKTTEDSISIASDVFFDESKATLVEFWLEELGFNYDTTISVLASKESLSGSQFFSASHRLLIDRETVIVTLISQKTEMLDIEIPNDSEDVECIFGNLKFKVFSDLPSKEELIKPTKAFLNVAKLNYPLKLRKWQKGDVFQPFGMKGKKKVSDFLIDEKVPVSEKEKVMVLCSDREIVWLLGYRISENFKIDKSTSQLLEVTYSPK
ncbi:tRNA lysidine(34) synthetase TilS [Arcticibacterium luteifluviistationis]|uniref:tRNA(Ile)-lysidine synthase n=1 Tax=Arcticibacterium luteifluviistationis TaxID=1784714 RepID=A0A2Z4GBP0_9BACT|nr:tRNA lysidine(34) synthetase TilS [Arcticibacterium luteifluviistationis]AWV98554.1 tRNA lysidine(34) synthetase TilS [Arcticibacterium luteifluviistationis]